MLAKDHRLPPNFAHGKFPGCFNGHLGFASDRGGSQALESTLGYDTHYKEAEREEKIAIPIRENVRILPPACMSETRSVTLNWMPFEQQRQP